MRFEPLGDQAVMAYCDSEPDAFAFAEAVRHVKDAWLVDVVQAYTTVAVFYDFLQLGYDEVTSVLQRGAVKRSGQQGAVGRLHVIPCCYELGQDLERVAGEKSLSVEQVIGLHTQTLYTVYAIGFCPGFPYLGYLPEALAGVPRLAAPRLRVEAGSVGLTGRQTGIYTEVRPGGWNIVGRTPLVLVEVAKEYFPLRTGDQVRFERIDEGEFGRRVGQRLPKSDR